MRQSVKETKLERMTRAGLAPERRESLAFRPDEEFADEPGARAGSGNGRRHPPAGRG
ncbi:hypothetical protein [Cohnella sp. REN36]|uniref:hypothetical protein n=1 Tax=Cohnella sp. REN36 TaxID=2887347 RepID=UPI001D13B13A|nr:hypothetical protein [Cohnella sp. REN36]MCC3376391.1 hypothetical protein [Cohnella sp. REN36]